MKQLTLATVGFERYAKTTRRAAFLAEMERVVPWSVLCALIEPFYPKPGNGRPPVGVERRLRIYFLQQWFNLSDSAVEKALYDSPAMRRFVDIDLGREPVPDATTVCRLRHLLEAYNLGQPLFDEVQRHLAAKGLKVAIGTIVDVTINQCAVVDQECRKGARSRDAPDEEGQPVVFQHEGAFFRRQPHQADPCCCTGKRPEYGVIRPTRGQRAVIREQAPKARDFTNRRYRHRGLVDEVERVKKARQVQSARPGRACDRVIKRMLGFAKVRCRGLKKKHASSPRYLRARLSVHDAPAAIGLPKG
jgi:IS5 family transposase